jgi:hypothetical protein
VTSTSTDVFISHSSSDRDRATELANFLAARGINAWVASHDVSAGRDWAQQIVDAIRSCKAIVVLVSAKANASDHVAREIRLATTNGKPILPVCLEEVLPARALEYDLALLHRVDAFVPPFDQHLERIHQHLVVLLEGGPISQPPVPESARPPAASRLAPVIPGVLAVGVVVAALLAYATGFGRPQPTPPPTGPAASTDLGAGTDLPPPKVVLEFVDVGTDAVHAEGSYENLVVGRDNVLLIGQPRDASDANWLPVTAQLHPSAESAGLQAGRWEATRPAGTEGRRYRWYAVIAPTGAAGGVGLQNDLNEKGPQSEFVEAVSEEWTSP